MSKLLNYYGSFDVPVPDHVGGQVEKINCDLAVIGGGGAGLSAAVRAAELGASVVVLEKMNELGGNTRLAGGLLCTNSELLKKEGVPDSTEDHIIEYRRQHRYTLDSRIYERFIRNTGRYYDWIVGKGLDPDNHRIVMDKVVMIKDRSTWEPLYNPAYGPGLMGSAVTDTLIKCANESANIKILLTTAAKGLKTDSTGRVVGVLAVGQDKDWDIEAKNVLLASGGFGCNNELLKKYFPQYCTSENYFTHYCLNHCTGDGIIMADAIGAKTGDNMSIGIESMVHMPGAYPLQRIVGQPEGVLVSATGRRFMPEDDMRHGEMVMDMQPEGLGWYIYTEGMTEKLYELAIENSRYGDWMPDISVLYEDIKKELENGLTKKASTIGELAAAIGAPAETLEKTLLDYEEYCKEGKDKEFGKDPKFLLALGTKGPWYAVRMVRKFDVTMGGVDIDYLCRAIKDDDSPIEGLYVCGDIASNWMGKNYGPLFSSFAWAVNSGMLTAEYLFAKN